MKFKALLPLGLGLVFAALFSGCVATQKTNNGRITNYAGGVVTVSQGEYQPPLASSWDTNTNVLSGNMANPSGKQTKVLWGLFTFNDY